MIIICNIIETHWPIYYIANRFKIKFMHDIFQLQKPVNVRFWRPPISTDNHEDPLSEKPRMKYTHGTKKRFSKLTRKLAKRRSYAAKGSSDFINIPRLGLLEINDEGVYTVGKSSADANKRLSRRPMSPLQEDNDWQASIYHLYIVLSIT